MVIIKVLHAYSIPTSLRGHSTLRPLSTKPLKDRFMFWQDDCQTNGEVVRGTQFLSALVLNVKDRQPASYHDFDDLFRGDFFEELPDFVRDLNLYAPAVLLEVRGRRYMPCVRVDRFGPTVQCHDVNKLWGPKDFALLLK